MKDSCESCKFILRCRNSLSCNWQSFNSVFILCKDNILLQLRTPFFDVVRQAVIFLTPNDVEPAEPGPVSYVVDSFIPANWQFPSDPPVSRRRLPVDWRLPRSAAPGHPCPPPGRFPESQLDVLSEHLFVANTIHRTRKTDSTHTNTSYLTT